MPILGREGIIEFSREWPAPMAMRPDSINDHLATISITLQNTAYWAGDQIVITASGGVPFDVNNDGYADCPDGHGIYRGGYYTLGPARDFYTDPETDEDGPHYQVSDAVRYYNTAATTGLTTQVVGYMSRDELERIRLWDSTASSLNAEGVDENSILKVACNNFIISRYSSNSGYLDAFNSRAALIAVEELPAAEQLLESVVALTAPISAVTESPEARGWLMQGYMQSWALDVDASNLDMTAIGETFGENTKALVRGAGSMQFIFEYTDATLQDDPLTLLRLVLLTQQGSKATARFYLMKDRNSASSCSQVTGSVYYETDVLLTNSRLNIQSENMVAGSTDFVATGRIALRVLS